MMAFDIFNDSLQFTSMTPGIHHGGDMNNISYEDSLRNAEYETIGINSQYDYRPDRVSNEVYGTSSLFQLILAINGCSTIFEFTAASLEFKAKYIPTNKITQIQLDLENNKY